MSKKPEVLKNKPDDQPVALWNSFKSVIKNMGKLTDEQLASIHYESWHAAYTRASGIAQDEQGVK